MARKENSMTSVSTRLSVEAALFEAYMSVREAKKRGLYRALSFSGTVLIGSVVLGIFFEFTPMLSLLGVLAIGVIVYSIYDYVSMRRRMRARTYGAKLHEAKWINFAIGLLQLERGVSGPASPHGVTERLTRYVRFLLQRNGHVASDEEVDTIVRGAYAKHPLARLEKVAAKL